MIDGDESAISADEHATWLKPDEALARLPEDWGRGHAVTAMITHLRIGEIEAVARRGLVATDDGEMPIELHPISPEFWDDDRWIMGGAIWVTGQVSFRRGSRIAEALGRLPEAWTEHTFTGVRFNPVAFESAFDLTPKDGSGPSSTSTVSAAELNRFVSLYLEIWADEAREMKAFAAVQSCYPDRHISRDPFLKIFRELRGPGKAGKPRKTTP